jgi:hypothetical protein
MISLSTKASGEPGPAEIVDVFGLSVKEVVRDLVEL